MTPAMTTVTALDGDAVVGELVRMLGAAERDRAATEHARELLQSGVSRRPRPRTGRVQLRGLRAASCRRSPSY